MLQLIKKPEKVFLFGQIKLKSQLILGKKHFGQKEDQVSTNKQIGKLGQ